MSVRVVTDSASYIPNAILRSLGIEVVPIYVLRDGRAIPETQLDARAFFELLSQGVTLPTTSQPAPQDFELVFRDLVSAGHDILAVLISGGMSGTCASAEDAARTVAGSSPAARIVVVDSRANCMQEGFAVLAAAEAAQDGASLAECERAARESMSRSRFLFAPQSLDYLKRGGRISAAGALIGSILGIVPVLTAEKGETGVAGRVRTRSRALGLIAELIRVDVERCGLKQVVVQTIGDPSLGDKFAHDYIEPIAGHPVEVIPIGPVIGLHVGPAVGVAYETLEPLA